MNKVISYSVWGDNPKYLVGAVRNAELTNKIYPGWKSRFYVAKSVSDSYVSQILSIDNTEVIHMWEEEGNWLSMLWRYKTCWDDTVDVSIFRDSDSRLTLREKFAVDAWLESDKTFHIMRDHPWHGYHMLGGMWGYKKNNKYDLKKLFDSFDYTDAYGTDYQFFGSVLFPVIGEDKVTHDEFFEKKPFPAPREEQHFVGEVYDENDNRNEEHYKHIK